MSQKNVLIEQNHWVLWGKNPTMDTTQGRPIPPSPKKHPPGPSVWVFPIGMGPNLPPKRRGAQFAGDQFAGESGNSHSQKKASNSRSRIMGMFFFIPFPFPYCGNGFFHSLPVPELWEWIFLIHFPFANLLFHRRESKRELDYCKRYQASNFFQLPLYFSKQLYWGGKLSQDV